MKFLVPLLALCAAVSAQLTAPTRNYNVTSPVSNGPYVVGQILPCTYRLFSDVDSSALVLQITLEPVIVASSALASSVNATNTTLTIAENADVTKTEASVKHEGNLTYFEHSINYNIPAMVKPGNYKVIFSDKSTNTKLPIPIEIRPAAVSTTSNIKASATGVTDRSQSSGSIFAEGAAAMLMPEATKTFVALAAAAGIAWML
ncbi:uncharacterized protein BYT42DRAFT_513541 [Radiomyces spectabilis]|uniref:uncharacterized protein n=1 Tax=Radiomyces spectabilis TaxID=64574 RepID=UPI002220B797|nr:uncharacterized protein BYT42DRAFT_513541 [Radiomyces spectabilis]KAI8381251.1 hypothetical protein BYT42DRAFT_513541 [Radiomyces spectabilis]